MHGTSRLLISGKVHTLLQDERRTFFEVERGPALSGVMEGQDVAPLSVLTSVSAEITYNIGRALRLQMGDTC